MFTLDEGIRDQALAAGFPSFVPKDTPLATLLGEIRRTAKPQNVQQRASAHIGVTARGVTRGAFGVLARRRRAIATLAILLVAYAAAFLISEPTVVAAAALLSMLPGG